MSIVRSHTLNPLQQAQSLKDIAELLGYTPSSLSYILYSTRRKENNYSSFQIPKKSGGVRQIDAPCQHLKLLQKKLANLLQNFMDNFHEKMKERKPAFRDHLSHGFKRKRSTFTNARIHRRKRYVFNIDLENFFGTINFGRVRGFFIKDQNFQLNPKVATVLAQIACHQNSLPQGSPCSPVISNLIGHVMDIRLSKLASAHDCQYSRYVDDLTFSTRVSDFPKEIAEPVDMFKGVWACGTDLLKTLASCGFSVNPKKTRMQYRHSRQQVTGLVVNRKVSIPSDYHRRVRAMVHQLTQSGDYFLDSDKKIKGTLQQLQGMLGYIHHIDASNHKIINNKLSGEGNNNYISGQDIRENKPSLSARERVYRKFVFFKDFYRPNRATIITEGYTDRIHITCAIHNLSEKYPEKYGSLVKLSTNGRKLLDVRVLKHDYDKEIGHEFSSGPKSIAHEKKSKNRFRSNLFSSGGTNNLVKFIKAYKGIVRSFRASMNEHPVIIVTDNDLAGKQIMNQLPRSDRDEYKKEFYHLERCLYWILIPKPQGADGDIFIENLYDPDTQKKEVEGKKPIFSNKDIDENSEYGKGVFAIKVIHENYKNINFDGFIPLLDRLMLVIENHPKIHAIK
jgi:RNA-directed DNA polymerase